MPVLRDDKGKLFGLVLLLSSLILAGSSCTGPGSSPSPDQPIDFSHAVHAGDYEIPCLYCHMYADRSPVAGVPTVKTCMGCHEEIGTDKPEVEKLTAYWEEKKPIEWIKIYDLPDFVRFTHKRHVLGGVECEECHGAVRTMAQVRRDTDLKMGWCLGCHEEREVDIDCLICHY